MCLHNIHLGQLVLCIDKERLGQAEQPCKHLRICQPRSENTGVKVLCCQLSDCMAGMTIQDGTKVKPATKQLAYCNLAAPTR